MKISTRRARGRKVWDLDNGRLTLTVMEGGGHLCGLRLHGGPDVNPYWDPIWRTIEPWTYRPRDKARYGCKLLAAICGHNLCLASFGSPSPEEERAGLENHGEAPVRRWKTLTKRTTKTGLTFVQICDLPIAQMVLRRTIRLRRGSNVIRIREEVRNLARRDVPFTMCEHVTFGPPFLEPGLTRFDMPATRGHTYQGAFGSPQRMKSDCSFRWPNGPGVRGAVDLRTLPAGRRNSDFSTQLIDPRQDVAWFSAMNPRQGLLVAYVWRRTDFPWVGNWEENRARRVPPWNRKSLTRGMEFSNAPFPVGLRQAVTMGRFFGVPTYRWLPARATAVMDFAVLACRVPAACRGVTAIRPDGRGFDVELVKGR